MNFIDPALNPATLAVEVSPEQEQLPLRSPLLLTFRVATVAVDVALAVAFDAAFDVNPR